MIENEMKDGSKESQAGTVRDYFETDYFSRDNHHKKNLASEYIFELNLESKETGLVQKIPIVRQLNFDYEANALYSYFFIDEIQPPTLMVLIGFVV